MRRRDDHGLAEFVRDVMRRIEGAAVSSSLPLDIQATAFQRQVWSYLQSIAFGETRSYAQVAKAIRRPSAVRAVARACATNPVPIAIPCHRVVCSDGEMGGYRWGVERKQKLLAIEASN
jgi:AraC family transcriptional regulator of adaptative response/methylated-DNA-[protein]-cysteine methyltransferase